MMDIAQIGVEANTAQLRRGKKDLDDFSKSGKKAGQSATQFGSAVKQQMPSMAKLGKMIGGLAVGYLSVASAMSAVAKARDFRACTKKTLRCASQPVGRHDGRGHGRQPAVVHLYRRRQRCIFQRDRRVQLTPTADCGYFVGAEASRRDGPITGWAIPRRRRARRIGREDQRIRPHIHAVP